MAGEREERLSQPDAQGIEAKLPKPEAGERAYQFIHTFIQAFEEIQNFQVSFHKRYDRLRLPASLAARASWDVQYHFHDTDLASKYTILPEIAPKIPYNPLILRLYGLNDSFERIQTEQRFSKVIFVFISFLSHFYGRILVIPLFLRPWSSRRGMS
jgi:hypothetical protein